jgi:hypothetical protein
VLPPSSGYTTTHIFEMGGGGTDGRKGSNGKQYDRNSIEQYESNCQIPDILLRVLHKDKADFIHLSAAKFPFMI